MGNRFSIGLTTPHRAECIQMQSIKIAKKSGRFWRLVYFSIPRRRTTCVEPFPQWRNGFSIGTNSKKKSSRKETTARNTLLYYIYTKLRKFVFEMIKSAIKIKYWTFIKSVNKFPPFLPTKKKNTTDQKVDKNIGKNRPEQDSPTTSDCVWTPFPRPGSSRKEDGTAIRIVHTFTFLVCCYLAPGSARRLLEVEKVPTSQYHFYSGSIIKK